MIRMFELVDGTAKKFWEITGEGNDVRTRYGKIGTSGQSTTKTEATPEDAQKLMDKLVAEKTKKGYVEVKTAAAPETAPVASIEAVTQPTTSKRKDEPPAKKAASAAPGILSAVKERNLLAKLGGDVEEAYQAFIKASPGRQDVNLFSDLISRATLGFEHGALLASFVRYARYVEPSLLWTWLLGLPTPTAPLPGTCGGAPIEDFLLEDMPLRLFCGVREAWKRAPTVFDPQTPGIPSFLRDTLLLVQAEAGQTIAENDRLRLLERLAAYASRPNAIFGGFQYTIPHAISWCARLLGASRDAFGEQVMALAQAGANGNLVSALVWWEPKPDKSYEVTFAKAVRTIPMDQLAPMIVHALRQGMGQLEFDEEGFARGRTGGAGLGLLTMVKLLETREDSGDEIHALVDALVASANALDGSHAREVRSVADGLSVLAHERAPGVRPMEAAWFLRMAENYTLAKRAQLLIASADESTRKALADYDDEFPRYGFGARVAYAATAMATLADAPARVQAMASRVRPKFSDPEPLIALGRALVAAMPNALETLIAVRSGSTDLDADEQRRRTWIVLGGLAERARQGGAIAESCDAYAGPGELVANPGRGWNQDLRDREARAAYGAIFDALPRERRQPLLAAWIAIDTTGALGVRDWLASMPPRVQADAPGAPSTAELVARLVQASRRVADTTIYLLERCAKEETAPTLRGLATSLPGLAASRIPSRRGKALDHLITFDFEQMPALRNVLDAAHNAPAFPDAAGVAFFLRSGGAWSPDNDDIDVVALTRDELAAGHQDGIAFRATELRVPADTFVTEARRKDSALGQIWEALGLAPGIALGAARRLQGDTDTYGVEKSFVFDADTRLLPMNMGDAGVFHGFSFGGFLESC